MDRKKLVCVVCQGTYFTTSRAEQFVAGGYGSAEFRSISNAPKTVLHCIGCGTPVTPSPGYFGKGTTAYIAEHDFRISIEKGQEYREKKKTGTQEITNATIINAEIQELRDSIASLKKLKAPKAKVGKLVGA